MIKHYQKVMDDLSNLMISLKKQKDLGLDTEVMMALTALTRSRNDFKRYLNAELIKLPKRQENIFTCFLDKVSDET